jgi:hypothetical protein
VADGESNNGDSSGDSDYEAGSEEKLVCMPKSLPKRLQVAAAKTAVDINPVNAPFFGPLAAAGQDLVSDPLRIAVLTSKYWGPTARTLSVSFMESTPSDLRARIISHMNAWTRTEGIRFAETSGVGDVRISRGGGGYWSYLGTDILHIPQNRQTMNLEGFTMSTRESEYKRVIRHETGHTLGFPHEHMRRELVARIDPQKAYDFFLRTQGWDQQTVDQQVLTALDDRSIFATPPDETSIMCYQLPGSITRDGRPILGGVDINQTDFAFAGRIYPKGAHAQHDAAVEEVDWEEEFAAV